MSDEANKLTRAERLAALDKKQAARDAADTEAREEQYVTDREAIDALSDKLKIRIHYSKQVKQFVPGVPVIVGVRAPEPGEYQRLFSKVNRSNNGDARVAALNELAQVCWVYPVEGPDRQAMLAANAGLLASVGNFANKLAEVEIAEEGKE